MATSRSTIVQNSCGHSLHQIQDNFERKSRLITLVVAYTKFDRVIGQNGKIPWKIPEDMKHFMETTMGGVVVMGRKTWDSLPLRYKPLIGRTNVVITRDVGSFSSNVKPDLVVDNVEEIINKDCFIIGGGEIYKLFLDRKCVDRIIASEIKSVHEGDTFFPDLIGDWGKTLKKEFNDFDVIEYVKLF